MKYFFIIIAVIGLCGIGFLTWKNQAINSEFLSKINLVYTQEKMYSELTTDTTLYSSELNTLIEKAQETTQLDADRIKKSSTPIDKPLQMEGSIFTSLYEGATGFDIENKKQMFDFKDKQIISVNFTNNQVEPVITWTDQVIFVHENGSWKIDDVLFDATLSGSERTSLKQYFNNFIAEGVKLTTENEMVQKINIKEILSASSKNEKVFWQVEKISDQTLVSDIVSSEHGWANVYGLLQEKLGLDIEPMDKTWQNLTQLKTVGQWDVALHNM